MSSGKVDASPNSVISMGAFNVDRQHIRNSSEPLGHTTILCPVASLFGDTRVSLAARCMTWNDSRSRRSIESLPKFLTTTRTRFEYQGSELVEKKASWFHLQYQTHKEIHSRSHRYSFTETSSNQFQIPRHQRLEQRSALLATSCLQQNSSWSTVYHHRRSTHLQLDILGAGYREPQAGAQ